MTQGRVNDDGEVVVEILGEVSPQLSRDNLFRRSVMAMDSKVDMAGVVQNTYLGLFGSWLGLKGLPLPEVGQHRRRGPDGVVQRPIDSWRAVGPSGIRQARTIFRGTGMRTQ